MPALGATPRTTSDTGEICAVHLFIVMHGKSGHLKSVLRIRDPDFFTPVSDPGSGISFFRVLDLGSRISDTGSQSQI
jgi:hypothetical protein